MKLPEFNLGEALEEVRWSFNLGGSATEKLSSTAKLLGKTAANVGMIAAEVGVDMVKRLPESNGQRAQQLLDEADKNSYSFKGDGREKLEKAVAMGKEAKAQRIAKEQDQEKEKAKKEQG